MTCRDCEVRVLWDKYEDGEFTAREYQEKVEAMDWYDIELRDQRNMWRVRAIKAEEQLREEWRKGFEQGRKEGFVEGVGSASESFKAGYQKALDDLNTPISIG